MDWMDTSSARSKGSNTFSRNPGVMPIPLSRKMNRYFPNPFSDDGNWVISKTMWPLSGVYLMALDRKFSKTCWIRWLSQMTHSSSMLKRWTSKRWPFFFRSGWIMERSDVTRSPRLTSSSGQDNTATFDFGHIEHFVDQGKQQA